MGLSEKLTAADTAIKLVGKPKIQSPLEGRVFTPESRRVSLSPFVKTADQDVGFEVAGPREKIFFDPGKVKAAIVTCGGLCPGLNNVIRAIVNGLNNNYNVSRIFGIKYGLQGFIPEYRHPVVELTPELVETVHTRGGSIIGTSRGAQDIGAVVDCLERMGISILFIIGGDGTLRAALKISREIEKRKKKISVIGVPKTIDNDISYVSRSFGFATAVERACEAIEAAYTEAVGVPNGVGLVKLMGRQSGFIAATASTAARLVDFVLVPENEFELEGERGFLAKLHQKVSRKGYAVVVAAEGAGQHFFNQSQAEFDRSGNTRLFDIGPFLSDNIRNYFTERDTDLYLKYIDPSYLIRSVPSNTDDDLFCASLGQHAVHAAMAGKTDCCISIWHWVYCHIPIELAISQRKQINLEGGLWQNVLELTGQGSLINPR